MRNKYCVRYYHWTSLWSIRLASILYPSLYLYLLLCVFGVSTYGSRVSLGLAMWLGLVNRTWSDVILVKAWNMLAGVAVLFFVSASLLERIGISQSTDTRRIISLWNWHGPYNVELKLATPNLDHLFQTSHRYRRKANYRCFMPWNCYTVSHWQYIIKILRE